MTLQITNDCSCAHLATSNWQVPQLASLLACHAPTSWHVHLRPTSWHTPMQAVAYCSRECQAKHWKEGGHKAGCSRLAGQGG